jgi:FkbM family methyltransferase
MSRWGFALSHAAPSIFGISRTFVRHPVFASKVLAARARYFANRNFAGQLDTPDGFRIETFQELIAYWSFFIEREGWSSDWIECIKYAPKPIVLDVGANAGLFTHLIWRLNRNAVIFSFDPLPRMAEKIAGWQRRTGANATIMNLAIAERSGSAEFFASSDRDTTASLKSVVTTAKLLTVRVATLDELFPAGDPIALIKIDVEGAEPEVLAGATQVLLRTKFLIIEAHTPEALQKVQDKLGSSWASKRVGASDFLFFRS